MFGLLAEVATFCAKTSSESRLQTDAPTLPAMYFNTLRRVSISLAIQSKYDVNGNRRSDVADYYLITETSSPKPDADFPVSHHDEADRADLQSRLQVLLLPGEGEPVSGHKEFGHAALDDEA
jgi:hypothetical protein